MMRGTRTRRRGQDHRHGTTSISATLIHRYDSRRGGCTYTPRSNFGDTLATLSTTGTDWDLRMEMKKKTVRSTASGLRCVGRCL